MYVPDCESCTRKNDCVMRKGLKEARETIWNIGREKSGRTDYILNGKYHQAEEGE